MQEFGFEHTDTEVCIMHPNENIKSVVEYTSLGFRVEVKASDINSDIVNT